jgi:predicted esterase
MHTNNAAPLFAALICLCLGGCVAHVTRDVGPPADYRYEPPLEADPIFDAAPAGPVTLSEVLETMRHHDVQRFSYPSNGDTGLPRNVVEGLYFRSRDTEPKKLVIVLPIWGTSTYPPSRISRGYARRSRGDAHVLWVYGEAPLFPWDDMSTTGSEEEFVRMAQQSAERYRSAVVDLRRLLDWAETREEIDESRIAVVGFSMSSLVAATAMANDARISAGVLMVGAAKFADIFATCGNRAGTVRAHVLREYGWTLARYRDFFAELFDPADPIHYVGRYDPSNVLLIDARFDDCMPRSSRDALWEATGFPRRIMLLARHRHAFYSMTPLGLNFTRRKIYRFLDERL